MIKRNTFILVILLLSSARGESGNERRVKPDTQINGLNATEGTSEESVELQWNPGKSDREFAVYRSTFSDGPYEELGVTSKNEYSDKSAIPGVIYWYRILLLEDESPLELSSLVSGYRKNLPVKGKKLHNILKKKVRKHPVIRNKKKKALDAKFNTFLQSFITNNVKLSIVMAVGKYYLKRGKLILLNDFDEYIFDDPERISYFIKEGRYRVKYHSIRFSRLLRESRKLDPAKNRLSKRLLENMLVFCIDTGEIKVKDEDDVERVVKTYEAVGVTTEYCRHCHDWRFRTILTGSSSKKIRKMMRDAQRKRR
jgi:hypothetical protein